MSTGTMREGSIYHDAYTGLEELEEQIAIANQMSTQITGQVPQARNSINQNNMASPSHVSTSDNSHPKSPVSITNTSNRLKKLLNSQGSVQTAPMEKRGGQFMSQQQ